MMTLLDANILYLCFQLEKQSLSMSFIYQFIYLAISVLD